MPHTTPPKAGRFAALWHGWLLALQHSPYYPLAVAALALPSNATGLYPYGPILCAALLIAPQRWRSVWLFACLGATCGALLLAALVQWQGTPFIEHAMPGLMQQPEWQAHEARVAQYGPWALLVFAALPIPQTPVVLITALSQASLWQIGLAVFAGKLVKYGAYTLMTLGARGALRRWFRRRNGPGQGRG
ncbi:MAG TPA: VTT domain-containing protein [Chitinimonas sp.]